MPVFQQFRLWLAQSSGRDRSVAAAAAVASVLVLVLASLPLTGTPSGSDAALVAGAPGTLQPGAATAVPGAAGPGAPGVTAPAGTASPSGAAGAVDDPGVPVDGRPAGTGTVDPAASSTAAGPVAAGCGALEASAPGISAEQIVVGVAAVDLAGPVGNAAFNIRPDIREVVDAYVDHINRTGGAACGRTVVAKTYGVNPIDVNDQRAECLRMVQDGVYSVLDIAGYAEAVGRTCFVQNRLPLSVAASTTAGELEGGYPYLYNEYPTAEKQVRDGILGAAEAGFFDAGRGFAKLGLLVDSCHPSVVAEIERDLAAVGVRPNQVTRFTLDCSLIAPPNAVLQAVVQHKSAGATHVFLASSIGNNQRYADTADQQAYRPGYATSDYVAGTASAGTWNRTFDGALGVTSTHRGELNVGVRNPRIQTCEQVLQAAGLPGIRTEKDDGVAMLVCDQFDLWRKAVDRAGPNPTREDLVATGLAKVGLHESGSGSDGVFDRPGKVAGGDFYRFVRFEAACGCWKVLDPTFTRGH